MALAAAPAAAAGPGGEAVKQTGSIVGRVTDPDGRPVAGAEVWTGDYDKVEVRARTGADGRFRLEPVGDEHTATLWAECEPEGLAREHFDEVRVFAGRETDLGDIALAPGARLSGRAVDDDGRPVAGAELIIQSWHHILGYTITPNGPNWAARGDEAGRFRTPALPVGETDLTLRAPGKARRRLDQRIEPGRSAIDLGDIRLDDEKPITGIVLDQDDRPVAGAQVVVDADYDHPATTDPDGRFAVRDAAIDDSWIRVEAPGYFDPTLRPIHKLEGQRTDLRLALQKAYTVEGSVLDAETGEPVEFEQVQLCTVERDGANHVTLVG